MTHDTSLPPEHAARYVPQPEAGPILRNLFELYLHDLSEWFGFETKEDGSYSRPLEKYWTLGYECCLLYRSSIPIGFAITGPAGEWIEDASARDLRDFFIVRKHRRRHLGAAFARWIWNQHPGPWLVRVNSRNRPAVGFWQAAISAHTAGDYAEEPHDVEGLPWIHFRFQSRG